MGILGSRSRCMAMAMAACLLLVACAGDAVDPSREGSPTPSEPTSAAPVSASAGPTAPAPDGAPPELAGRWRRNVQGETVILTLDGTGYHIQRGPASGSGRISVVGDEVEFSGSNLCDGRGTYTWSFEEGRLRFTEVVADPCDGRTVVLLRGTFGRVDD